MIAREDQVFQAIRNPEHAVEKHKPQFLFALSKDGIPIYHRQLILSVTNAGFFMILLYHI